MVGSARLGAQNVTLEKSGITSRLVSELVATQFPHWADLPVRPVPVDGVGQRDLPIGRGDARQASQLVHYVAQVEKEREWLPKLAGQLPLPIPRPLGRGVPGGVGWPARAGSGARPVRADLWATAGRAGR